MFERIVLFSVGTATTLFFGSEMIDLLISDQPKDMITFVAWCFLIGIGIAGVIKSIKN